MFAVERNYGNTGCGVGMAFDIDPGFFHPAKSVLRNKNPSHLYPVYQQRIQ